MWLTLKPEQTVLPLVDKANTMETRRGVSFQHPEILAHAELVTSTLSEPYYWKLPEQFRGSMITAYGGQLKYAVYYEARDETGPSSYEPQVIIKGGPNRSIMMTRHIPGLQIGQLTRHEIDMTEHEWKYADGRSMTREDFMDILFYVDYILIKASHGNLMRHSRISEISLTVAEEGRPTKESEKAHQIEKCDCPIGYSGLSCEECAAGFYRLRTGSVTSASASRVPIAAGMGSCVQCQCSGHSSTCDPETSICQSVLPVAEGFDDHRCWPGPEDKEGNTVRDVPPVTMVTLGCQAATARSKCSMGAQFDHVDPVTGCAVAGSGIGETATKVSADGEQVEDDADRIHKRAEDLEQFIRDTLLGAKDLQSKAAELNQTLSRRDGTPDKSLKEMKEEIQAMLAEMRKRQLGGKKSIAEEEMDLAESYTVESQEIVYDPHQAARRPESRDKGSQTMRKPRRPRIRSTLPRCDSRQAGPTG
ncbi:laminin subunit alpha-2-like protein [Lates japonicus]|uniref:Laminin subunit alpha-2-like protein n=1 Tax=Lates japonicus TaxID=270547 RepID=A0AAD3NPD9_LATJO|nr:laminin subunit alpha-2-like protein [Lates japonicus]